MPASANLPGTRAALSAGEQYGRCDLGGGRAALVEFVSADPNGPLTLVHGRSAVVGDCLANLLDKAGYRVQREFYVNDAGGQMERFGRSVEANYLQLLGRRPVAGEEGFPVDLVRELAESILRRDGDRHADLPDAERLRLLTDLARAEIVATQRETLASLGVRFDRWFHERELHEGGQIAQVIERLRGAGCVYEADGALWLRATEFGDDQDRPLVRSNGQPTYIAADLAYHLDKLHRGFDLLINLWGPDHAGYVARTRAGFRAMGIDDSRVEILIFQPVTMKLDGLRLDGLNQKSYGVMLADLARELGARALRFAFLAAARGQPLELDLDLARGAVPENPAHHVPAAAARARALLAAGLDQAPLPPPDAISGVSPSDEAALALDAALARFPQEVGTALAEREPHRLAGYAAATATLSDRFGQSAAAADNLTTERTARLALLEASRLVLESSLELIGVSAPERNF